MAGCERPRGRVGSATDLVGPRWLLASYSTEESGSVHAIAQVETWIILEQDGSFRANTGVNDLTGTWSGDDESVAFNPGETTDRAAAEEIMKQERVFLDGLAASTGYILAGSGRERALSLREGDGRELLVFDASTAIPLAASQWVCTGYDGGNGSLLRPVTGTEMTIVFGDDGSLTGSAGCNDYSTTFDAGETALTIQPDIQLTTRACPADVAEQEQTYVAVLARAFSYSIVGTRLEIRDAQGMRIAAFELAG